MKKNDEIFVVMGIVFLFSWIFIFAALFLELYVLLTFSSIVMLISAAYIAFFGKSTDTKESNQMEKEERKIEKVEDKEIVYEIEGVRGRSIKIYKDKVIINVKTGIGSLITGNATDGEKTIYYRDVIGVQFKKSGVAIGYLQLETASTSMNNRNNNFFNENSFTFDTTKVSNEKMEEVASYVKKQVETYKNMGAVQVNSFSAADEIKKYKELLDIGAITQEEYDTKKKELLK